MNYKPKNSNKEDFNSGRIPDYNNLEWRYEMHVWCRKHGFSPDGYDEKWLNEYELEHCVIVL